MPRLSSRSIGPPAFAAILLLGILAVSLMHTVTVAESDPLQAQVYPAAFDQRLRVDPGKEAVPRSDQAAVSVTDQTNGWTPIEKTDFSSPGKRLQINEPKLFLATAGKTSDGTTVSLTNSTEKVYAYTSSLDDLAAGFVVNVCSDGFVRPNSHCALNITYKPKVRGNSAAKLSLRFVEVGGGETETLTVMLSGYAMANCDVSAETGTTSRRKADKGPAAGCGDTGAGDLAQVSGGRVDLGR
jgi:hypothetical protein